MQAAASDDTTRENTVGANIRLARDYLNLTQGQLARRLERDRRQVSEWERGIVVPSVVSLREIAMALGRHIEWFLDPHDSA